MPISNPQLNGMDLMSLLTGIGVDASGQQPQSPTEGQEGLTLDAVRPRRSDKFIDQLVGPEAYPGVGDEERRLALLQAITSLAGNIGGAIGSKGRSLAREGSEGLFGGPLNEFRDLLGKAQQGANQREEMEARREANDFQKKLRAKQGEQWEREDKEREFNTGVAVDALAGTEEDMGILRGAVDPFLAETDPANASERSRVESLMADIQQIQRQIRKRSESGLEVPDSMIASFEKKRDEILTLTKTKEEYDAETVKVFNDQLDELVNVYNMPKDAARDLLMQARTAPARKTITDAEESEATARLRRAQAGEIEARAASIEEWNNLTDEEKASRLVNAGLVEVPPGVKVRKAPTDPAVKLSPSEKALLANDQVKMAVGEIEAGQEPSIDSSIMAALILAGFDKSNFTVDASGNVTLTPNGKKHLVGFLQFLDQKGQ